MTRNFTQTVPLRTSTSFIDITQRLSQVMDNCNTVAKDTHSK